MLTGNKTIWNSFTLQTEPFDHAYPASKPFGTGSPCKQNHLIMLTDKPNHLEQVNLQAEPFDHAHPTS
jgi:hypothetical protein